jgi:hypothetical protein
MTNTPEFLITQAWRPVTLDNGELRVVILAEKGTDVYSIVDVRSGVDVMFKTPWRARPPGRWVSTRSSLERWIESYVGGWQILLPNGGDECIVDGVTWPFHGEAAMIPWEVLNRSSTSATFETRLIGVPLHVRRTFEIEGRVLRLHETVTNESRDSMEVMWSHHPAFGAPFIDETCVISAGCSTILADELAPGSLLEMGSRHPWPLARDTEGREINFSRVPGPDAPSSVLAYLTDFESGYFAIRCWDEMANGHL